MDDDHRLSLPGGLPPLPKSLSAAIGSSAASSVTHSGNASPLLTHFQPDHDDLFMGASTSAAARVRQNHQQRHGSLSSTQESLSDRESVQSRASSTHSSHQHTPTNNGAGVGGGGAGNTLTVGSPSSASTSTEVASNTLNTQLAILRREMYGLRQLDLNLLSQLWALNESIQGFRVFLQEQDALSPPSPSSPTPSDSNSLSSDPEDESFAAPAKALPTMVASVAPAQLLGPCGSTTSHASTSSNSGTSGSSSAASSMGKHGSMLAAHLQHQQQQQQQHLLSHKQQKLYQPQQPVPPQPNRSHPQLPRILQQRMRRAPPPPPPPAAAPTASLAKAHSKTPAGAASSPSTSSLGSMAAQMAAMPMPSEGAKPRPL